MDEQATELKADGVSRWTRISIWSAAIAMLISGVEMLAERCWLAGIVTLLASAELCRRNLRQTSETPTEKRYSARTMLVVTGVISVVLGVIVWATK